MKLKVSKKPCSLRRRETVFCFKRCQFWIILSVCTGILLYQATRCVEKYLAYSTGTGDTYVDIKTTSFPELTICSSKSYKLDIAQENGISSLRDIQFDSQWISNDSEKSAVQFYEQIVYSSEEMIKEMEINIGLEVEGKLSHNLQPNDQLCNNTLLKPKPYYYFGDCHALHLPDCILHAGTLEITLTVLQNVDIFIHHHGQFFNPNSR